jgi:hypothetical protein
MLYEKILIPDLVYWIQKLIRLVKDTI